MIEYNILYYVSICEEKSFIVNLPTECEWSVLETTFQIFNDINLNQSEILRSTLKTVHIFHCGTAELESLTFV